MRCPLCSEEIQEAALKCRFCGEFLEKCPSSASPTRSGVSPWCGLLVGAILGFVAGVLIVVDGCKLDFKKSQDQVLVIFVASFFAVEGAIVGFGVATMFKRRGWIWGVSLWRPSRASTTSSCRPRCHEVNAVRYP